MAIIIRFSVRDTNPSGTLLSPPTQAHFNSAVSNSFGFGGTNATVVFKKVS